MMKITYKSEHFTHDVLNVVRKSHNSKLRKRNPHCANIVLTLR